MPTVQASTSAATTPLSLPFVAADATGHKFNNTGKTLIVVRNVHATLARTVTIAPAIASRPADSSFPTTPNPDLVGAVPALATWVFGPFPTSFNDAAGQVSLAFSAAADVSIAVIEPNIR
jgi:hypothetical protein